MCDPFAGGDLNLPSSDATDMTGDQVGAGEEPPTGAQGCQDNL